MKKKLLGLIAPALAGLLLGLAISAIAQSQDRQERFREWSERRREAETVESRVALEARLVKIEAEMANYNRRLDWIEKVVWGAIVGMLAIFSREALSVYFSRQHRRQPD